MPDANYAVTVNFYKAQADAAPLYFETQASVPVKNGLFTIQAGATKPLNNADFKGGDAVWVGLKIASEPELPRVAVKFVPYALRAQMAADLACTVWRWRAWPWRVGGAARHVEV